MPKRLKRPTRRKRLLRRKRKSKASVIKNLKQSAKEAVKAGLTGGQIAGIVVGSTAVAGLGTAAAVLAARDKEFYDDYVRSSNEPGYKPSLYQKFRGYPERHKQKRLYTNPTVYDPLGNFKQFRKKRYITDRGKHRENMSSIFDSIKAARPSIEDRYERTDEFDRLNPGLRQAVESMGGSVGYGGGSVGYGKKKRRRRRKKRKFGGSCDEHGGKKFGKKVSKKPSAALRRLCKKHKVRLTVKRGKKRVYKSEKVLKKQCKNAMKKQ